MKSILDCFLDSQSFIVLDGALATELEGRGADLHDSLWSAKVLIESPEMIREVHLHYLRAGADIISTASYQATINGFMERGLTQLQAKALLRLSAQLALDARDEFWSDPQNRIGRERPLVAASLGPYGAYLADGSEYSGDYGLNEEELVEFHRPRLEIMASTDVDLFAFETVPCLQEGRAIVRLLDEYPQKPAWISYSCRDGEHVNHGELIADCAQLANTSDQVIAVGINCTAPRYIMPLVANACRATNKPIVVYPNSGESYDARRGCWVVATKEGSIASGASAWNAAGAKLIGGCCRTTPDDIRQIRDVLNHSSAAIDGE